MRVIFVILTVILLSSCSYGDKHNGKIVKDIDGKVYRLEHRVGDTYFIKTIDLEQIKAIDKFSKLQPQD
jgi:uncharacterized membrane protein AbrB (regulator of aidB expression)